MQSAYIKTLSPACAPSLKATLQLAAASLASRSGGSGSALKCNVQYPKPSDKLTFRRGMQLVLVDQLIRSFSLIGCQQRIQFPSWLCDSRLQCAGAQSCKLALLIRYLSRTMMLLKRFDAPEAAGNDPAVLKAASRLDTRARDCAPLPCASRERFSEDLVQYLREAVGVSVMGMHVSSSVLIFFIRSMCLREWQECHRHTRFG